jgi:Na+-transporting NADH:ubiquinone oxidoreductase subunit NqrD
MLEGVSGGRCYSVCQFVFDIFREIFGVGWMFYFVLDKLIGDG